MLRDLPRIQHNLADYILDLSRRHEDVILLPYRFPTYVIRNPEDIRHVLITNPRNYHKTAVLNDGTGFIGEGLLSCEAPKHTKHRKMMQPAFHRSGIASLVAMMGRMAAEQVSGWRSGTTVDLVEETTKLTMTIVGQALFGADLRGDVSDLGNAILTAQLLIRRRLGVLPIPLWIPTPDNVRYREAISTMNRYIASLIANRRKLDAQPPDLLGMLLQARGEDGSQMGDGDIRDEIATFLFAGHETVSNHLNWTFYLISGHPEVEAKLHAEWNSVLGGAAPTADQIPLLRYTSMVSAESLRLFPPVWAVVRSVVREDKLPGGLTLHPRDEVLLSQYVCHRNPEYFPEPERFAPERWTCEFEKGLPPGVYFPFGAGPRNCIGEPFARTEAAVLLPAIGQRFRLRTAPSQVIEKLALLTLRPRYGLKMELQERNCPSQLSRE